THRSRGIEYRRFERLSRESNQIMATVSKRRLRWSDGCLFTLALVGGLCLMLPLIVTIWGDLQIRSHEAEVERYQQMWNSKNIESYQITLIDSPAPGTPVELTLTVRDGEIIGIEGTECGTACPDYFVKRFTVEGLFVQARDCMNFCH